MYSAMAEKDKEEGKAEEQKGEDAEKKGDAERADDGGEEQKTEEKEEKDIKPQAVDEEQKKAEGEAEEKSESDAKPAQNDELKDKKEEDAADETEEAIGAFFFLNINWKFFFVFFFQHLMECSQMVRRKSMVKMPKWKMMEKSKEKEMKRLRRYLTKSAQVTSERFEWIKQWDFVLLCFQRKVVKMRRRKGMKSGICSWPGRCWRWLRSFTKGVETVYDRLLKYKLSTE